MVVLLITEYRFFRRQAEKMCALKEDYRSYTIAVKKILDDYCRIKERLELFELHEKKNGNLAVNGSDSYDQNNSANNRDAESFIVVNRDLQRRKENAISYFKEQDLDLCGRRVPHDTWLDYTDLLLNGTKDVSPRAPQRAPVKRARVRRKKPLLNRIGTEAKRDINLSWPVERSAFWFSSLFGYRKKPDGSWGYHHGLDMSALRGTPVKAAADGIVVEARYVRGYGKTVVIAHNQKYKTRYAHLDTIHVHVGQKVVRGRVLGNVGSTGFVRKMGNDASHLHFELSAFNKRVNPLYFLS
jgi:murein DD-endopeptidase MepM/ murein hydrolase activator NlpD